MRRVSILSFTERGDALAEVIAACFEQEAIGCAVADSDTASPVASCAASHVPRATFHTFPRGLSREERHAAVRAAFQDKEHDHTLVFVGALGIAIRLIAPYISDKYSDPAVLVADDLAHHVISVLSGHAGGANLQAVQLAAALRARGYSAQEVVTTATDVRGAINAEQVFTRYGIPLAPHRARIKEINAQIAQQTGDAAGVADRTAGTRPAGALPSDAPPSGTPRTHRALDIPALRIVYIGTGCKRDTPPEQYCRELEAFLGDHGIVPETVAALCSIELKAYEPAIHEAARWLAQTGCELRFFSAEELRAYEDIVPGSAFVRSVTGVASVAGTSAAAGSGGGRLLTEVRKRNGCTFCAAIDARLSATNGAIEEEQ